MTKRKSSTSTSFDAFIFALGQRVSHPATSTTYEIVSRHLAEDRSGIHRYYKLVTPTNDNLVVTYPEGQLTAYTEPDTNPEGD